LPKPFTPEGISCLIGPLLESNRQIAFPVPQELGESLHLTLQEALVEALETMAFISPDLSQNSDLSPTLPELRVVRVGFHGHGIGGSLALAAPPNFCQVVANNCTASDGVQESDDALKELANVTCGLLLRKRLGGGAGFKMNPPVMGRCDEMIHWIAGDGTVVVSADGYLVAARATMDAPFLPAKGGH
jgi:hypothetical protein